MWAKIKIHEKSGMAYFPDEVRNSGFSGELDLITGSYALLLIRPMSSTESILESLEIFRRELMMRDKYDPAVRSK